MISWPFGYGFTRFEVLRERLAGDGQAVAVQQARVEQHLHQRRLPPISTSSLMRKLAARLEVGEHRDAFADAREVVDGQLHAGGVRHGEQVQHGVGRAAERDDDGDGVLEGLARHDVARADAALDQVEHGRAGRAAVAWLLASKSRPARSCSAGTCRAPRWRRPWCWRCTCRRRSPRRESRMLLDQRQFLVVDLAVGVLRRRLRSTRRCRAAFRERSRAPCAAVLGEDAVMQPGRMVPP